MDRNGGPDGGAAAQVPIWLRAKPEDVEGLDFEAPVAGSIAADCFKLTGQFEAAARLRDAPDHVESASDRVFAILAAVTGMYFKPDDRNEPFGPMMTLADGRRSPAPADFRGEPVATLAELAERAINPVLRARLADVCWTLERKRAQVGNAAVAAYVEIVRRVEAGELKFSFDAERGDFVSGLYILTPMLENSLRHVLKGHGHDVTTFDDATQTQQDRTISLLFEQMSSELDAVFTRAITADMERVFLSKPGPHLRHSVAHGLLPDSAPYGADAIYACWFIFRLCMLPLFPHRDQLRWAFD